MDISIENAQIILKKYLDGTNKYEHSYRVAKISRILADKWGESVSDAVIAALLHDIGKRMNKQQMLSICSRNNVTLYDFEIFENALSLHGKVSAILFEEEFKGNDSEKMKHISHAISSHVAGDSKMTLLDKIIFVADNLDMKEGSKEILDRILADELNPDECVEIIIQEKVKRNNNKKRIMNPLLDIANKDMDDGR